MFVKIFMIEETKQMLVIVEACLMDTWRYVFVYFGVYFKTSIILSPLPSPLPTLQKKKKVSKMLAQLMNIILFQSTRGDNERNQVLAKRNSGN